MSVPLFIHAGWTMYRVRLKTKQSPMHESKVERYRTPTTAVLVTTFLTYMLPNLQPQAYNKLLPVYCLYLNFFYIGDTQGMADEEYTVYLNNMKKKRIKTKTRVPGTGKHYLRPLEATSISLCIGILY